MFIWALYILPVILAITLHEAAHGYVAYRLGDKTAYYLGRVTLNPIKHIDLIGTVVIPIVAFLTAGFIFGWAKPVPINPSNLKTKSNIALTTLAGPVSNFLQAILWLIIFNIFYQSSFIYGEAISFMAQYGVLINILLGLLNLLPILPLDGGRIIELYIPHPFNYYFSKTERFGLLILVGFMFIGLLNFLVFNPSHSIALWLLNL